MIFSQVPTVNRIPGTNGFQNRMRFTSLLRVRTMSSRHDLLPERNRPITERSTFAPGQILVGAETRLPFGEGSTKVRINQRPNHPGVICSTGESAFSSSAAAIGIK